MGKIMLVDTYGDVPYNDALKDTTSILPRYNEAQDIHDLFRQTDAGIALLSTGDSTLNPGPNDILFKGDIRK